MNLNLLKPGQKIWVISNWDKPPRRTTFRRIYYKNAIVGRRIENGQPPLRLRWDFSNSFSPWAVFQTKKDAVLEIARAKVSFSNRDIRTLKSDIFIAKEHLDDLNKKLSVQKGVLRRRKTYYNTLRKR